MSALIGPKTPNPKPQNPGPYIIHRGTKALKPSTTDHKTPNPKPQNPGPYISHRGT